MNKKSVVIKDKENNEPLYKGRITEVNISLNAKIEYLKDKETDNFIYYRVITENNINEEEYETLVNLVISQLKQVLLTENIYTKTVIHIGEIDKKKSTISITLQFVVIRNPQIF